MVVVPEVVSRAPAADPRGWSNMARPHQSWGEAPLLPSPVQPDRPRFAGSSLPDHLWLEAVAAAIKEIEAGKLEKVVLARDHALWSKEPFELHRVLEQTPLRLSRLHGLSGRRAGRAHHRSS